MNILRREVVSSLILMVLVSGVLFATGSTEQADQEVTNVIYWKMGNGPDPDAMALVDEKLNEALADRINVTVERSYIGWSEWRNKYELALVSGEDIDLIDVGQWSGFARYARDGAFTELSQLLAEYAPDHWDYFSEQDWARTAVNGQLVAVPPLAKGLVLQNLVYREDLRKKYNVPEFTDLASLEPYFDAILENEPGMDPLGLGWSVIQLWVRPHLSISLGGSIITNFGDYMLADPMDPTQTYHLSEMGEYYVPFFERMKAWRENGYWTEDVLGMLVGGPQADMFHSGQIGVMNATPAGVGAAIDRAASEHPDWELGWWSPAINAQGWAIGQSPVQDAVSVPIQSDKAEAALKFLDTIKFDESLYDLFIYGVEGLHYENVGPDTIKLLPDGISPSEHPYQLGAVFPASVQVDSFEKRIIGTSSVADEIEALHSDILIEDYWSNFAVDAAEVRSIESAIANINDEMLTPLMWGFVDDVEEQWDAYVEAVNAAGLDRVREFYVPRWLDHLQTLGIE